MYESSRVNYLTSLVPENNTPQHPSAVWLRQQNTLATTKSQYHARLLTFRLGHHRPHVDDSYWPVPGRRLLPEGSIDLCLLDRIVLVVGTVGPRHQGLGDPPAIDPDSGGCGAIARCCCCGAGFVDRYLHGSQNVESLRARLHPRDRRFRLGGALGAQAAHGHPDPGWGAPRPDQHLLVVPEPATQEAPAVGLQLLLCCLIMELVVADQLVHAAAAAAVAAKYIAPVNDRIQLQLLFAVLDGVPFSQQPLQLPAAQSKGSDAQASEKYLSRGSKILANDLRGRRGCRHGCDRKTEGRMDGWMDRWMYSSNSCTPVLYSRVSVS
jgi:hypothetical protein